MESLECPKTLAKQVFHRRRYAQSLVNAAEVVVHIVKCKRMAVILDLLRKPIR